MLPCFATGTSWGTFGILIPIVVHAFEGKNETMMIIAISACMAGTVCGDHCSPISDTTIMASAGAQCNHINHVNTQLPYAASCAVISFITYIVAWICTECMDCTSGRNCYDACIFDLYEVFTEEADSSGFFTEEKCIIQKMRNGFSELFLFCFLL